MSEHGLSSWDLFVLRHRKPLNLAIHFVSLLCFYVSPVVAFARRDWRYLAPFLVSGIVGAIGHYISGDGGVNLHETTSSPKVIFYVPKLFYKLARGEYHRDLQAADERYAAYLRTGDGSR